MREWLKRLASKASVRGTVPGVRIPLSPPIQNRIFPKGSIEPPNGNMKENNRVFNAIAIPTLLLLIPISSAAQKQTTRIATHLIAKLKRSLFLYANDPVDSTLLKVLINKTGKIDCPDTNLTNPQQFHSKKVLLNKKGSESLVIIQGPLCYCSPTGNCPLWIFHATADGYKEVGAANAIQTFAIESSKTMGLPDIMLSRTESADWSRLILTRFNGRLYRNTGCYNIRYRYRDIKNGPYREHKKPRITPCYK